LEIHQIFAINEVRTLVNLSDKQYTAFTQNISGFWLCRGAGTEWEGDLQPPEIYFLQVGNRSQGYW